MIRKATSSSADSSFCSDCEDDDNKPDNQSQFSSD